MSLKGRESFYGPSLLSSLIVTPDAHTQGGNDAVSGIHDAVPVVDEGDSDVVSITGAVAPAPQR